MLPDKDKDVAWQRLRCWLIKVKMLPDKDVVW